jgi:hypothetical protein
MTPTRGRLYRDETHFEAFEGLAMSKSSQYWFMVVVAIGGSLLLSLYVGESRKNKDNEKLNSCLEDNPQWAVKFHSKRTDWDEKKAIYEACTGHE